ncbi:hypothetical protein [Rubrivivax gelatinosus]|uniref:Uncharacterized protein n=1 Tax=Rubrivivax gelatinosus TaxID=28068 RepID=A0A4R2MR77_RUBGE|nr:hypothetical protein [Rubrivivax gelatinosus]MBK1686221.1 hypothetical protein [Rubrivivax gelatinosus]TCP05716.1 hypothetical protein EV684_101590 [Rubrivivax gelatinosus]
MPEHDIQLSEADTALLEQVRQRHGLDSIEQAAEMLAKARLRRAAHTSNGRGRALQLVAGPPQRGNRS